MREKKTKTEMKEKKKKIHTTKALLRVCEHVNVYICFYSFHLLVCCYCYCCCYSYSFISHAKNLKQKKKKLKE